MNNLQMINVIHVLSIGPGLVYFGQNGQELASVHADKLKYLGLGVGAYYGYKYIISVEYPLKWIYLVNILLSLVLFYIGQQQGQVDKRIYQGLVVAGIMVFAYHLHQLALTMGWIN